MSPLRPGLPRQALNGAGLVSLPGELAIRTILPNLENE